ncbi:MAG: 50S ribosomal protein L18e [Candidatus Aenigmarchaeota archaeon]|nr:50S ribosomal protein L18e [Candidatus Aenigmarchaeota archaeon]MDW8149308.1 50S ribosomal protein L18e [Candidatus Aenigmarchaeota archaeon]
MVKRSGPTNPSLKRLLIKLEIAYRKTKRPIWKALIEKLNTPRRKRVEVNIFKIDKFVKENEIAVIPGKVLSVGELSKPLTIAAWRFSKKARVKIEKSGGKAISINELIESNPKNLKIIC